MPALEEIRLIAIDGPPATGKSKLCTALARHLDARQTVDPVKDDPFLERFLKEPVHHALHIQISALISRYKQQATIAQPDLFHPQTVTNYSPAKNDIYAQTFLHDEDYHLYRQVKSLVEPAFQRPDVVIYLQATADTLGKHLEMSNKDARNLVPRNSLATLIDAYDQHFLKFRESPVLVVNAEKHGYQPDKIAARDLLERLLAVESGCVFFDPSE